MEMELNKKQNRKVTIFAIILSAISIGLLIFGFTLVSSNKVVMLQSISNLSGKFEKILESNTSLSNQIASNTNIGIKSNINLSVNELLVGQEMSLGLNLDYLENKTTEKSTLALDLKLNNNNLLGGDIALANQNAYIYVEDITPRYYYTKSEYMSLFSSLSSKESDKIIALLKEIVTDYIDNDDIKSKKVTIKYNGKDKKVNKLTYKITSKVIKDILTDFFTSLENDKDLFKSITKVNKVSEKELSNTFKEILESFNEINEEDGINYNVYYYGFNKIVQYELETIDQNTMIKYHVGDKETISLYVENEEMISISITKNKKKYDFEGFFIDDTNKKVTFSGNVNDNKFTLYSDIDNQKLKIVINSENQEEKFIYKNDITFSVVVEDQETDIFTLKVDSKYYFGEKVNISLTDSTNINEITEEDMTTIQNNFMNHPIYQLISNLIPNLNNSL